MMTSAIIQIDDLKVLFADVAPLYMAKPTLDLWLGAYLLSIVKNELGEYRVCSPDGVPFLIEGVEYNSYLNYGDALWFALNESVARAKKREKESMERTK